MSERLGELPTGIMAGTTGDWYGFDNGTKEKVARACCQIMKLGADVLWVHTSYPCESVA